MEAVSIDADGMGDGVCDRLTELKYNIFEFRGGLTGADHVEKPLVYGNVKTEWYSKLCDLISQGYLGAIPQQTIDSLLTVMYTHRSNGQKLCVPKEAMKRPPYNFKSPDDADSLMIAYYATQFIGKAPQEEEDYRTPVQRREKVGAGNLFKIAGYR